MLMHEKTFVINLSVVPLILTALLFVDLIYLIAVIFIMSNAHVVDCVKSAHNSVIRSYSQV